MKQTDTATDIIIIGAGAAGLLAGKLLTEQGLSVCLLEARNRTGGRINTLPYSEWNETAEGGAEFIHGKLKLTLELLKEAGLKKTKVGGEMWQVFGGSWQQDDDYLEKQNKVISKLKTLKEDISIAAFLSKEFAGDEHAEVRQSITSYVEGYYAGDVNLTSSKAFLAEWESEDEEQYRPVQGYQTLLDYLLDKIENGRGKLHLSTIVKQVNYLQNSVEIIDSNLQKYTATKAIITVPLGVWRAEEKDKASIQYHPALPQKMQAAFEMGFGSAIKILLRFKTPFWQQDDYKNKDIGFVFSDQNIGTWWTQNPLDSNLLTGWLAGPRAYELRYSADDIIFEQAIESLQHLFSVNKEKLSEALINWKVYNWTADPYALGAYSFSTLQSEAARKVMVQPVENTLFFAGEALYSGTETGTVEAAFISGKQVASQVLTTL
ncbi:MAG: FAD-dependent oxidoreductase [Chitinophagaceae bacterium]|nr:FAD-dependent oxidoreductase [Chitinophagaceae bacterium]